MDSKSQVTEDVPIRQLLLAIAQMLVDDSSSVSVDCITEDSTITLNLGVAASDTGKIIGKQGRTARSIRTILSAAGMKSHRRYALNIEEDTANQLRSNVSSGNAVSPRTSGDTRAHSKVSAGGQCN